MFTNAVFLHPRRSRFVRLAALATVLPLLLGLLGACNLAQKTEGSPPVATVKADIACRSGPTAEYDIRDTLSSGKSLDIQGRNRSGDAWMVYDPAIQEACWVKGVWVQASGALGQVEIIDPDPPGAPSAIVRMEIGCGAGPTAEYALRDTLKAGEVLNIQGRNRSGDAWVLFDPDLQGTCWVGGMWVDVTGALSQVQIIDPDPPTAPTATVKVDTTCRSGPTSEYAILDYLKPGTVLNIVSRNRAGDSWVVENPNIGRTCWIPGFRVEVVGAVSQVQIIDPDPPSTPTPEAAHGGQAPSVNCSQYNSNTCNQNPACTWEGGTCKNK